MKSSNLTTQSKLQHFIEEELLSGTQKVALDDQLLVDGYVDSVGIMRLVSYIDETLGKKVPMEDFTIENFGTIDALVTYLEGLELKDSSA